MRDTPAARLDLRFLAVTVAAAAFVLYASFYPFHFSSRAGSPYQALLSTYHSGTTRSDAIANVLFYFPLGFFAARSFSRPPRFRHVLLITAAGSAFSVTVELMQFYERSRISSLADVYANTAGALAGAAVATLAGRRSGSLLYDPERRHAVVLLLLGCWLISRLFPLVPTADLHQYWRAVKPLIFSPNVSAGALYRHFVTGLAVAALIGECVGVARSRVLAAACLLSVVCARIAITGLVLSPAEVIGSLAGAVCWAALFYRLRLRMPIIAALLASMIAAQSLEPFRFLAVARPFGWAPFRGMMQGSISVNIVSLFEKSFAYGALVWFLQRSGWRLWLAATASAAFVLVALAQPSRRLPPSASEWACGPATQD